MSITWSYGQQTYLQGRLANIVWCSAKMNTVNNQVLLLRKMMQKNTGAKTSSFSSRLLWLLWKYMEYLLLLAVCGHISGIDSNKSSCFKNWRAETFSHFWLPNFLGRFFWCTFCDLFQILLFYKPRCRKKSLLSCKL